MRQMPVEGRNFKAVCIMYYETRYMTHQIQLNFHRTIFID